MRTFILAILSFVLVVSFTFFSHKTLASETRCGWLDNPTPANWYLTDADGVWILGVQGGYQAPGWERVSEFTGDWVYTNGNHGYTCACFKVTVDPVRKRVKQIYGGQQIPLSRCEQDPALPTR